FAVMAAGVRRVETLCAAAATDTPHKALGASLAPAPTPLTSLPPRFAPPGPHARPSALAPAVSRREPPTPPSFPRRPGPASPPTTHLDAHPGPATPGAIPVTNGGTGALRITTSAGADLGSCLTLTSVPEPIPPNGAAQLQVTYTPPSPLPAGVTAFASTTYTFATNDPV